MATIMSITSLDLTHDKKIELVNELENSLGQIYTSALAITFQQVDAEFCTEMAIDQTTFFVCVPPQISIDKKRKTIEIINDTMLRVVGYKGQLKNIVLFHYHTEESVGKDGELLVDMIKSK